MENRLENLTEIIVAKLEENSKGLTQQYQVSSKNVSGTKYFIIDNLLPKDVAKIISAAFPDTKSMRLMRSYREKKYTTKNFEKLDKIISDVTFAFQDSRVVQIIERITHSKDLIPDSSLYAGGLSSMTKGHFLGPHLDNSHSWDRRNYRAFNLLYYVSLEWAENFGGNLELWDKQIQNYITIESRFNRLVVMETNPFSWHSVSKVSVNNTRKCVSNYYFSKNSPTGSEYHNVTLFSARPEELFKRIVSNIDNTLRQMIRTIIPSGLGKRDFYKGRRVDN